MTARGDLCLSGGEWEEISADAKDLVGRMLATDPLQRIGTEGIMKHPWLQGLDLPSKDHSTYSSPADAPLGAGGEAQSQGAQGQGGQGQGGQGGGRLPSKHSGVNLADFRSILAGALLTLPDISDGRLSTDQVL
ncbi:hypothetical protein B484DRAFT_390349 [Ochromonadaceae sp. CCMP2298]|nr:hypothetical protein B484DRAFT_390349 [Ochromonadaceae sp. CCMP2298]